jgi:hypothetical protein
MSFFGCRRRGATRSGYGQPLAGVSGSGGPARAGDHELGLWRQPRAVRWLTARCSWIRSRPAPGIPASLPCSIVRTLARQTRFRGASWGANSGRYQATPSHCQPLSGQLDGTSGHAWHRSASSQKCLLSSRSRVRIALGAQVDEFFRNSVRLLGAKRGAKRQQPTSRANRTALPMHVSGNPQVSVTASRARAAPCHRCPAAGGSGASCAGARRPVPGWRGVCRHGRALPALRRARAVAVVAADAAFCHLLADRIELVAEVRPYLPGQFYLRELPPLHAVLDRLQGLRLLIIDGYADLDPQAGPAWAPTPMPVRRAGHRRCQDRLPHRHPHRASDTRGKLHPPAVCHRCRDAPPGRRGPGPPHGWALPAARCPPPRRCPCPRPPPTQLVTPRHPKRPPRQRVRSVQVEVIIHALPRVR